MLILMGDVNAMVGTGNSDREDIMEKEGLGEVSENGDVFVDVCAFKDLCIGGSLFQQRKIHKATWSLPDLHTYNQIGAIWLRVSTRTCSYLDTAEARQRLSSNKPPCLTVSM